MCNNCNKRSSVVATLVPETKYVRVDKCLRYGVETIYRHGIRTVASCCGHGRYPMTIVCFSELNGFYELFSGRLIHRTRNFYRKDKNGFYYIPEINGGK